MAAVRVTAMVTKAMVGSLIWVAAWTMPTSTPTASMAISSGPPTHSATSSPRRSSVRASSGVMGRKLREWAGRGRRCEGSDPVEAGGEGADGEHPAVDQHEQQDLERRRD